MFQGKKATKIPPPLMTQKVRSVFWGAISDMNLTSFGVCVSFRVDFHKDLEETARDTFLL